MTDVGSDKTIKKNTLPESDGISGFKQQNMLYLTR